MKRLIALLLAALLLTGCTAQAASTPQEGYEAAVTLMISGDHVAAAEAFTALSGYDDAPQMAIYCRGLAAAGAGDYATAVAAFTALGDFKDSRVKATWFTGVGAQAEAEAAFARGTLAGLQTAKARAAEAEAAFAALPYLPEAPARLAACRALAAKADAALPALRLAHECEAVGPADGEYFAVSRDGLWGVMHVRGETTAPCQWEGITAIHSNAVVVCRSVRDERGRTTDWRYGLTDLKGNVLVPCEMHAVLSEERFIYLVDEQNEIIVYSIDDQRLMRTDEITAIKRREIAPDRFLQGRDRGWALTDGAGNVLFADEKGMYSIAGCTAAGSLWLESEDDKVGLLSADGEMLLPAEYTDMDYRWRWADPDLEYKVGLLSADGEMLLPVEYIDMDYRWRWADPDLEYKVLTAADGTVTAYGADGRKAFDSHWKLIAYGGGGLFEVYDGKLCGIADAHGRMVVPCIYNGTQVWGGFIAAGAEAEGADDGVMYIFNHRGEVVLTARAEDLNEWSISMTEDYFIWAEDGLLRIIDQQGEEVF